MRTKELVWRDAIVPDLLTHLGEDLPKFMAAQLFRLSFEGADARFDLPVVFRHAFGLQLLVYQLTIGGRRFRRYPKSEIFAENLQCRSSQAS
ncbi:hypothetical protein ACXIVK_05880 [Paraburkholderia caledonica]